MDCRFLVINNCHSELEYFFHYNHGLNSNKFAYFNSETSYSLKVYIFGMCKLRGILWCIIYANWMLLKIWPTWLLDDLTIHLTNSKLYIFLWFFLTSRVTWYTWKAIICILKIWPPVDTCWPILRRAQIVQNCCQNSFWPITTSKPSITHFRRNDTWVLLPLQSSIAR